MTLVRTFGIVGLGIGLGVGIGACSSSSHDGAQDAGIDASGPTFTELVVPTTPPTDLDLLFVIDNSPSMADKQANLAANFAVLLQTLSTLPGGLPNLHIGVVTTDLGTRGAADAQPGPAIGTIHQGGCAGLGDAGNLRTFGAPVTGLFISDVAGPNGTRITNYPAGMALADVFAIIAKAGDTGCGFEQPLEAMKQALLPTNAVNKDFLREGASLGVVFVTDEDDCSLAHSALIADGAVDTLGALQSFRCTRFGITCDTGGATPDAMNSVGAKADCHPSDDGGKTGGYLTDDGAYATFLHGLKTDPSRVAGVGIMGTTDPFAVELRTPPASATAIPALAHACQYFDDLGMPEVADPPIRLQAFLLHLGAGHARESSICQQNLSSGLEQAGVQVRATMGDPCFRARLLDSDLATDGLQPTCTVSVDNGATLPACGTAGTLPCYRITDDGVTCGRSTTQGSAKLELDGVDQLPTTAHVTARCQLAL